MTHPLWEPNHAEGGKWVSYDETGDGGIVLPNVIGFPSVPTALFTEFFTLAGIPSSGSVMVWADDTASVSINGIELVAANGVQDQNCAAGPVACTPGEGLLIDLTPHLRHGYNSITFGVYQRDGGPFGVLYEGVVESHAPEPATMGLFGSALAGLALWAKRSRRSC
jgi:hypothetical protein